MPGNVNNPKHIAERGREIYNSKYRDTYEREHWGKFVAVDIRNESATLGDTGSEAMMTANRNNPSGLFHLIRVGYAGAYELGLAYKGVIPSSRIHR